jgi:FMN reductase
MDQLKLVVVSAGLSQPSATRMLADRLAEATWRGLREQGREVDVRVVELRDLAVDIAKNLVTGFPSPDLADAVRAVEHADGLVVVSPIFSASYSGLFKSFFDVLDNKALTGKPMVIGATGGTPRHSLALEHALRPLFSYLRAIVMPTGVYAATEDWGASSGEEASSLGERIERAGGELAGLLGGRPPVPQAKNTEEIVVPFEQLLAG